MLDESTCAAQARRPLPKRGRRPGPPATTIQSDPRNRRLPGSHSTAAGAQVSGGRSAPHHSPAAQAACSGSGGRSECRLTPKIASPRTYTTGHSAAYARLPTARSLEIARGTVSTAAFSTIQIAAADLFA
jgi:hypothetical protein